MHFSNQVQRHQKLSAFIIYEIQKLRNIPPFLQKQFLESGYDETKGNLVKALLCKPWSNLGPFKPNCVEYFLNLNCIFWIREHHLEPCLKLFLWDQKLSFFLQELIIDHITYYQTLHGISIQLVYNGAIRTTAINSALKVWWPINTSQSKPFDIH